MRFRERANNDQDAAERQNCEPAGEGLTEMRQAGEQFLRAGREAIDRALSENSEAFLAASRQQGGE